MGRQDAALPSEYQQVVTPVCPDAGSDPIINLLPTDPDNGATSQ